MGSETDWAGNRRTLERIREKRIGGFRKVAWVSERVDWENHPTAQNFGSAGPMHLGICNRGRMEEVHGH